MSALPKSIYSASQYLALEENCAYRSEFYLGEIYAMAGASRKHNKISMNVSGNLHSQLRKKLCEVYQNDMRVKVHEGFYTYPDVVIVCDTPKIEKQNGENLLNPLILIEVLSPSTERFDRGEKGRLYRLMPSLKEYVLISRDKINVEHYVRQDTGKWLFSEMSEKEDILSFQAIECEIILEDIYEKIVFNEE
jgi:Uma2 family endonuclease